MLNRLKDLMAAPIFEDEEAARIASLLNTLLLTSLVAVAVLVLFTTAVGFTMTPRAMFIALLGLLGAFGVMKAGHLKAASIIFVSTLLLLITYLLLVGRGLHDETIGILPVIIIIAGLVFEGALFFLFTSLTIAVVAIVSLSDYFGMTHTGFHEDSILADFVILTGILLLTAVVVQLLSNSLKNSLSRARESEETYKNFIAQSSEGIWRVEYSKPIHIDDPLAEQAKIIFECGYVAECNDILAQMYGYEAKEDIVGLPTYTFYGSKESFAQQQTAVLTYIKNNYRVSGSESHERNRLGERVYFNFNAAGIVKDGFLIATWGIQRDITALKRAEMALRDSEEEARTFQKRLQRLHEVSIELSRTESLAELCRQAVIDGREKLGFDRLGLLLFDEEAELMVGTFGTDDEGNLRDERDFAQKINRPEILEILTNKKRIGFWEQAPLMDKGQQIGRGWNAMAVLWNGDKGIGWLATDNFLKKEPPSDMQLELLTLFGATLGHLVSVKQAEESMHAYAKELERSNQELKEFAYVSSHDLQEPLRKIRTFADRMQTVYGSELDDKGQDYLFRMQDAAARMQFLIQDLLMYSRVNTKTRPFEPVDLNVTVDTVLSDLEVRIEETQANIQVGELPTLFADRRQMYQLFQNLVSNALKFHHPERSPQINIACQVEHSSGRQSIARISVQDNGIGFDNKYQERIFTVFQRLNANKRYTGTGIGLAICRRIVERHQGQIKAHGRLGEGATFEIILPIT